MTEIRKSSWQIFRVDGVDESCLARSLQLENDVLPEEAQKELARIVSRHRRQARLEEIDKLGGEVVAVLEAFREWSRLPERVQKLADAAMDRIRIAREQAQKDGP